MAFQIKRRPQMMKGTWTLPVLLVTFLLVGCNTFIKKLPDANSGNDIANLASIEDLLEGLARTNLTWMGKQGWLHIEQIPGGTGEVQLTYRDRWIHFTDEKGKCAEELYVIRKTKDSTDGQRWFRTKEGFVGELVILRAGAEDALEYAGPRKEEKQCTAEELSTPLIDLRDIQANKSSIDYVKWWREEVEEKKVVILEIAYSGYDQQLGIPPGASGKIETMLYDEETGNRIKYTMKLIYPADSKLQSEVWLDEHSKYWERLPEEIQGEIIQAEKELLFYVETR